MYIFFFILTVLFKDLTLKKDLIWPTEDNLPSAPLGQGRLARQGGHTRRRRGRGHHSPHQLSLQIRHSLLKQVQNNLIQSAKARQLQCYRVQQFSNTTILSINDQLLDDDGTISSHFFFHVSSMTFSTPKKLLASTNDFSICFSYSY